MTIKLDNRVAVYIPSTIDVNKPIDTTRYVNRVLDKFTTLFGGSTAINARGAWQSEKLGVVYEEIKIVESFTDNKTLLSCINSVREIALQIKSELKQESIAIKVNDKLELL